MLRAVAVFLVAVSGVASANPTRPGFYGEVSLWAGAIWGESRFANGYVDDEDAGLGMARFSLGGDLELQHEFHVRLGAAVDVFNAGSYGLAGGIETRVDRRFASRWCVGLRLAGSIGEGNGSPKTGDGQIITAGLRLHDETFLFGVDGLFVRHGEDGDRAFGNGFIVGAGVTGRAGKYAIGGSAALAAIGGVVVIILLSTVQSH